MNFKFPALPGLPGGLQFLVTEQPQDRTKLHSLSPLAPPWEKKLGLEVEIVKLGSIWGLLGHRKLETTERAREGVEFEIHPT